VKHPQTGCFAVQFRTPPEILIMTYVLIIAFIAWVLYLVSKAPNTDEGHLAALFTAVYTFAIYGCIAVGGIVFIAGIFAF
jgi:hypothetical protein